MLKLLIGHVKMVAKKQISFHFVVILSTIVADILAEFKRQAVKKRPNVVRNELRFFTWFPDFVSLCILIYSVKFYIIFETHELIIFDQKLLDQVIIRVLRLNYFLFLFGTHTSDVSQIA